MSRVKAVNQYTRFALVAAQLITLLSLILGLNFVIHTTGGSLFLFASIGPVLVGASIILFVAVAIYRFRASHNLFEIENLKPGDVVFRQGETGECAYFIHSGKVEVVKDDVAIATLGKDQYFGEMALISSSPRNATIRAVEETQVAVLGKSNFLRLINVLPATKEDILKTVQQRAMQQADKTK
jgi:hypothetical protein